MKKLSLLGVIVLLIAMTQPVHAIILEKRSVEVGPFKLSVKGSQEVAAELSHKLAEALNQTERTAKKPVTFFRSTFDTAFVIAARVGLFENVIIPRCTHPWTAWIPFVARLYYARGICQNLDAWCQERRG